MKPTFLLALIALTLLAQQTQKPSTFALHTSAELTRQEREIIRKVDGSKPSFAVLGRTSSTTSALIYRAATGEAELHDHMCDFFVVRSGRATLVLGGRLKEPRTVSPGEFAAPAIEGGATRRLAPGDVVYIPAKLPHHVLVDQGEPISYLLIKAKEE